METFKVEWMEKKNEDWIVATLSNNGQMNTEVSINRTNKKGEVFPHFDEIQAGRDVAGQLWVSDSGKKYLFAPKVTATKPTGAFKGIQIEKAQEKKAQYVAVAQDNKERGIMTSSTIRMAVDIALSEVTGQPFDAGVFKGRIKFWREWLIAEWDNIDSAPPFN